MKVAILADSHFDEHSRFEECIRIHDWIAEDIQSRGVNLVLHAGDIFERKSTPLERQAVAAWVQKITDITPLVIVRGNHDALDDLPLLQRLEVKCFIEVVEGARVVHSINNGREMFIACLAWPQRARLAALLPDAGKEGVEQAGVDVLRDVLRGLGQQLADTPADVPRIFLAHARVMGSKTSTGQALMGSEFEIGLDDLALVGADFYALGDIHLPQEFDIGGVPCVYAGSPRRCSFGEPEVKSYVIAEFDGRRLVGWERIPTPATNMILIEQEWNQGWVGTPWSSEGMQGAEVRFRYRVSAEDRDAARNASAPIERAMLNTFGAVSVKIEEEVEATTRARTPEVAAARTLPDKLQAFWTATGFDPGPRREGLIQKVTTLESGVAA